MRQRYAIELNVVQFYTSQIINDIRRSLLQCNVNDTQPRRIGTNNEKPIVVGQWSIETIINVAASPNPCRK